MPELLRIQMHVCCIQACSSAQLQYLTLSFLADSTLFIAQVVKVMASDVHVYALFIHDHIFI